MEDVQQNSIQTFKFLSEDTNQLPVNLIELAAGFWRSPVVVEGSIFETQSGPSQDLIVLADAELMPT